MRTVARTLRIVLRLAFGLALLIGLTTASRAEDLTDQTALTALFDQLRTARDEQEARAIDQQIWTVWMTPSDPAVRARMRRAMDARSGGNPLGAILILTRLTEDYPTYAEAWNQRATMFYVLGHFDASLADCAKVLELEPRHFGALSGRALIYLQLGKRALALKDMAAALAIHPFLTERRLFPELQQNVTHI